MDGLTQLRMYSSSDSEEEEEEHRKHKERLPLPELFFSKNNSMRSLSLKEENNEGKVRNFPHERGNWATYVYLPVDSSSELLNYLEHLIHFTEPLNLKLVDDFHISLTRTVVLKHHWIQDFTDTVKKNLVNTKCFNIHLHGLKTYSNEQKTRTFLSLCVDEGEDNLKEIVNQLNNCLKDYNLESYYEKPSFHVSLLWCGGDKCSEINKFMELLPLKLKSFGFFMEVSSCVCTSGNKSFSFSFF